VGRSVEELGEGVRLGFRSADLSGVLVGRSLSTGSEVSLVVGVLVVAGKLASRLCWVWGICLATVFSGRRGKLLGLVGLGSEAWGRGGGSAFACFASASCFSTSLTDGGALIDSSILLGFIEILASRLTLTASSTMLIRFVWG
jgi:hypothetical protein